MTLQVGRAELGQLCDKCGHRWLLHGTDRDPICIAWVNQQFCHCTERAPIVRIQPGAITAQSDKHDPGVLM